MAAMEHALRLPQAVSPDAAMDILMDMATLLVSKQKNESAQPLYARALPLCLQALVCHQQAADPLVSVDLMCTIAECHWRLCAREEAQSMFAQALRICRDQFGQDHPQTMHCQALMDSMCASGSLFRIP